HCCGFAKYSAFRWRGSSGALTRTCTVEGSVGEMAVAHYFFDQFRKLPPGKATCRKDGTPLNRRRSRILQGRGQLWSRISEREQQTDGEFRRKHSRLFRSE